MTETFQDMGLSKPVFDAISDLGYVSPTPIQQQAIPVLLQGTKDFVGLAQTGTGKTAAFGLPLLSLIDTSNKQVQGLVICPTRELCIQITNDFKAYGKYLEDFHHVAVYGGSSIDNQIKYLRKGVQIVVATPGRLIDLIERKAVKLDAVTHVVLDEADEMLNMGFREDIEFILSHATARQAAWLFSATMPKEVRRIAQTFMENPVEIKVNSIATAQNIKHVYYQCQSSQKYETLKRLIDFNPGMYGIVFTRTKLEAQDITEKLLKDTKEIAEHVMLVDLGRNDLGRVCENGTIHLAENMVVEKYSHVLHIVSSVKGKLKKTINSIALLKACFPAGTLTGAPKIEAIKIISKLENEARGPYGGCIGYINLDGTINVAIMIRTIILEKHQASIQCGAGIVADSSPESEYQETFNKARALMEVLSASA